MASEGASPEIASVEVPAEVPKSPRPMLTTKGPKVKKDKQKVAQSVRTSLRKHLQKENPTA